MGASKKIDLVQAQKALTDLEEASEKGGIIVSVSEFIKLNFDKLQGSGLSRRSIYEYLKKNGVDLGSFASFTQTWYRYAKGQKAKAGGASQITSEREQNLQEKKESNPILSPRRNSGLGLRPIRLPDGTEVEISETGAKTFKI